MKKRVIALLRVSTSEQAATDKVGIARQQAAVERVCGVHDLECVRTVELVDVSGTSVRHCREIQEIIEDVRTGAVDGIAVAALDRLARTDRFEDFGVFQAFQDAKAVIFADDGVLDFAGGNTFMLTALKAAMAGSELASIRARMEGGKEEMRKKGRHAGSALTLPRGVAYDRKTHAWSYTPEVDAIVEAFRLIDEEGVSNFNELSRRVALKATGLKVTLRNPIYTGWRVIDSKRGGPKRVGPDGRQAARGKVKRAPEEVIRVQVISEPAVAPDRFERVQAILDAAGHRWRDIRAHSSGVIFLVGGIARCGYCGCPLYGSTNLKGRAYYRCRSNTPRHKAKTGGCGFKHARRADIDDTLRHFTAEHLAKPETMREIIDHAIRSIKGRAKEPTVENVEAARGKLRRRRALLIDAYEKELITPEELAKRTGLIKAEELSLAARTGPLGPDEIDIQKLAMLIARGAMAFARIRNPAEQKKIVDQLYSTVDFKDGDIVGFTLRPQFLTQCTESCYTGIRSKTAK